MVSVLCDICAGMGVAAVYAPQLEKAYMAISFEREAYAHGRDFGYLSGRRRFAQWRRADA